MLPMPPLHPARSRGFARPRTAGAKPSHVGWCSEWRPRLRSTASTWARAGASWLFALGALAGCGASSTAPPWPALLDADRDGRIVIACLGDSNTDPAFNARLRRGSWCERLEGFRSGAEILNLGAGGGSIACASPLEPALASQQLARAQESKPDVWILSFITNDARYAIAGSCLPLDPVRREQGLPIGEEEIGGELLNRLEELLAQIPAARIWILLAPPVLGAENEGANLLIEELNELLRRQSESDTRFSVIDHPALETGDYEDPLHMNESGQAKRARQVAEALLAAREE